MHAIAVPRGGSVSTDDQESREKDSPERLPRYADELRPVRDFGPGAPSPRFRPHRERPDQQPKWGPLLAAAAAGFLLAVVVGPCRNTDPRREEEFASLQSELQSAQGRVGQLESQLSAAHESVGESEAPEGSAPEPEQPTPPPKPESPSEPTPEAVSHREEPIANPEATKSEPAATPRPAVAENPPPKPLGAEGERVALAEPQGSDSVYEVPDPSAPIV